MIIFKRNYMNLIGDGMIGNSNCIGTILNGFILNQPSKELNPFQFLPKSSILVKMIEQLILLVVPN